MNKLLDFQMKVSSISKDSENPFFKSKYFDINKLLETIKPVLNEMGIVILQPLRNIEGRPAVGTVLYDTESEKTLLDETITLPDLQDPQKMGSAITYYRRYGLQSALGLEAEDDDGNLASNNIVKNITPITPIKKESKSVSDIDKKKLEIVSLCNRIEDGLKITGNYKSFVLAKCGVELEEKNFNFIIDTLNEILKK